MAFGGKLYPGVGIFSLSLITRVVFLAKAKNINLVGDLYSLRSTC